MMKRKAFIIIICRWFSDFNIRVHQSLILNAAVDEANLDKAIFFSLRQKWILRGGSLVKWL